jgi:hypothetical protein
MNSANRLSRLAAPDALTVRGPRSFGGSMRLAAASPARAQTHGTRTQETNHHGSANGLQAILPLHPSFASLCLIFEGKRAERRKQQRNSTLDLQRFAAPGEVERIRENAISDFSVRCSIN